VAGKKSKYISELHAAPVTVYSPTTHIYSTKLHGVTHHAIKLIAKKGPKIPNEITIIVVRYKGSLLSLIVPYV
jgi:hypothetical protein